MSRRPFILLAAPMAGVDASEPDRLPTVEDFPPAVVETGLRREICSGTRCTKVDQETTDDE